MEQPLAVSRSTSLIHSVIPTQRDCPTCNTPLPSDAVYCAVCGGTPPPARPASPETVPAVPPPAAPTQGRVELAERPGDEAEGRQRLQLALGDGYEVRELLGRGGFGLVFTAFDKRLKRDLAVKVLRMELAQSANFMDRFEREAMTAAQLRHPNIVPIYTIGEKDGLAYIVMPLIKGETLQQLLERDGPLPMAETTRILTDAASALAAAHGVGLIHRDIKPDNIMLEGTERRVLLMDFGIAKMLSSSDAALTGTGVLIGTPLYMSPEQGSGDKDTDQRSDIYSFGVVAYHMITGKPPFAGTSGADLIRQHVLTPATDVRMFRPTVPPALAAAVMKCLVKDRTKRWQSAEELRVALQNASGQRESGMVAASLFRFQRNVARLAKPLMIAVGLSAPVAAVLLLRSREEVPPPTLVAEPPAPVATNPVDSLLLAARGAASYARQLAVSAGATRLQLAAGDSVRHIADSLALLDRKAEAAVLLTSAASLWEKSQRQNRGGQVGTPQPGQPAGPVSNRGTDRAATPPAAAPAQSGRSDSVTVSDYYNELARAIESRQLGEVKRLLPNLSPNDERNWRNLFEDRGVDSIDARFTVLNVTRRESVTYARVHYSQNVVKGTRTQPRSRTIMATLTLGPQGWRQIREESAN
jgi:serine/threonine protein kinase